MFGKVTDRGEVNALVWW